VDEVDYERYLVKKPIPKFGPGVQVRNRTYPSQIYMSSQQVPEAKYFIEFGWIWGIPVPRPLASEHRHNFDEIVLHIGADSRNPEDLGAELEYIIGGQILKISTTSALFVPKGVKHGMLTYNRCAKPHVQIKIMLGTGDVQIDRDYTSKWVENESIRSPKNINYEKNFVRKPTYEVLAGTPVKHRQGPSSMTLMNNNLVPGSNIYIECGWVWGMPDPNPHIFEHVHNYEEIVVHFGNDYKNPEELGAAIEFYVAGQPLLIDKTSAIYVPEGVKHGPLIWKEYSAPHLEMAIMPGAGTLAEADPGGHIEKKTKEG
jgi:hypothetical protein